MPKSDLQTFRLKGNPHGFTVAERLAFRSSEWDGSRSRYKRATHRTQRRNERSYLLEGYQEYTQLGPITAYQPPAEKPEVVVPVQRRKPFSCTMEMISYLGYDIVFQTPLEPSGNRRLIVLRKQDGWIGLLQFDQEAFNEAKWFFTNRWEAGEHGALDSLAAAWDRKVLWADPYYAVDLLVSEAWTWPRYYLNQVVLQHSLLRTFEVLQREARRVSRPILRQVA